MAYFPLNDPATRRDPYPVYARLRDEAPAWFSDEWGCWVVTRHADVSALFRDARLSAARSSGYAAKLPPALVEKVMPVVRNLGSWALISDAPKHTRLRGLLNKAFTPRLAHDMRPRIERLVDELLHLVDGKGELDVVADLAYPLPVTVIGDLMGLPVEDAARLKNWSNAIAAFLGTVPPTPAMVADVVRAVVELEAYFRDALAARRARPREDLLTALLQAEEAGQILDEQELLSSCAMLLFGGHETTTHLIGNALHVLLDRPEALAQLRDDPSLDERATEELLRFESPVQRMGRVVKEDLALHGETLRAGDRVYLMIGAANRDGAVFADPDRLDFARAGTRHLAFGLGPHYCVGAALGRTEAALAVGKLVRRFPRLRRLDEEWRFIDNVSLRGLERLRVATA